MSARDPDAAPARLRVAPAPGFEAEGRAWAERLGLPLAPAPAAFDLCVDGDGPGLRPTTDGGRPPRPLRVDFLAARPGAEEVVRAVRGRRGVAATGRVVDATAGLGVDAAALIRAGLEVTLIEREPLLHALLEDALARLARADGERAARTRLLHGDAADLLPRLDPPEVVYLDPMYPAVRGGAKRRGMAWVRALLGGAEAEARDRELLRVARRHARTRVVVKRPAKAPPLAPGPSGSLRGRTTRFDLYAPRHDGDARERGGYPPGP